MTPAAASTCAPWQTDAMGLFACEKCRTIFSNVSFRRMYSGARPPEMTSAS
jgi:hypothetical protein